MIKCTSDVSNSSHSFLLASNSTSISFNLVSLDNRVDLVDEEEAWHESHETSQKEEIDGHDKGVPEEDKERRSTLHL